MSGFNWDDDNNEFRDVPDEVHGDQPLAPNVVNGARMRPTPAPAPEQPAQSTQWPYPGFEGPVVEGPEQSEEDDYEAVLADANLRIDIASLYKMVMNHDLFSGLDVDERAIETVQKQIRKFARERMEVMLGMRQDTATSPAMVSSPFNDLEVLVLKKLASQMSKGVTESEAAKAPQPEAKAMVRKEGLNTIGGTTKPSPKKVVQQLATKPQSPLQRPAKPVVKESKPLEKPIHEMSEEELLQRNKEASERQASRKAAPSKTALPQPTYEQEEMLHMQKFAESSNSGAVSAIVAAMNRSKSQ